MAEVKYPIVKPLAWHKCEDQNAKIGKTVYDVAGLIFISRDFPTFEAPLASILMEWEPEIVSCREFVGHMRAVLDADLDKPIIFNPDGVLLDGRHRIAKAIHEGRDTILAVRFEEHPAYMRIEDD